MSDRFKVGSRGKTAAFSKKRQSDGSGQNRDHSRWPIDRVLRHFGWQGETRGPRWTEIKCPFHGDRHRSAGFNKTRNIFRCHACSATGNSVTLVMQQLSVSERDAVDWLQSNIPSAAEPASRQQDKLSGDRIYGEGNPLPGRLA